MGEWPPKGVEWFYSDESCAIACGDCRNALSLLPAESVDAIATDPPYGLEFMGKEWDKLGAGVESTPKSAGGFGKDSPTNENAFAAARIRYGKSVANMQEWHRLWAIEALRVLKPGGHALVFGGTRTHHRLMCGLEDAGFEIRDCLMWVYGSGFPKSLDVSKAIDKAAGANRELKRVAFTRNVIGGGIGIERPWKDEAKKNGYHELAGDIPVTDDAKDWDGWGTALKPAYEPVILCRKPLEKGLTVAQNVLKWGTGALNIDACRVGAEGWTKKDGAESGSNNGHIGQLANRMAGVVRESSKGRWPANLIHDGSEEVVSLFPETQSGNLSPHHQLQASLNGSMSGPNQRRNPRQEFGGDSGSAARFFYTAKASGSDRGNHTDPALPLFAIDEEEFRNTHPTVKPVALMRYLIKLITPPKGVVLDPFAGSGSTLVGAKEMGVRSIGIEQDQSSCSLCVKRLSRRQAAAGD